MGWAEDVLDYDTDRPMRAIECGKEKTIYVHFEDMKLMATSMLRYGNDVEDKQIKEIGENAEIFLKLIEYIVRKENGKEDR